MYVCTARSALLLYYAILSLGNRFVRTVKSDGGLESLLFGRPDGWRDVGADSENDSEAGTRAGSPGSSVIGGTGRGSRGGKGRSRGGKQGKGAAVKLKGVALMKSIAATATGGTSPAAVAPIEPG
jgi:hypothetical protein